MSNYNVGDLELSIKAIDDSAASLDNVIRNLTNLIEPIKNLSIAAKGLSSMDKFANGLKKLSAIDLSSFSNNIQKVAESAPLLSNIGSNLSGLNKISTFSKGLEKLSSFENNDFQQKITSIVTSISPLTKINFGNLGTVSSFANGLKKLSAIDLSLLDTKIKGLTETLKPFLAELSSSVPALTAFSSAMTAISKKKTINFSKISDTGILKNNSKNISKNLNLAGIVGKLYFIRNYTKQIGQSIANMVQNAIDYTETLNLWQVAMSGNISVAEEFISKMNKAYGIAEQTLMQYQATFKNMLSSLGGISTDVSYALSGYLTQMALDYASLYNTSIERAMTVFESVLSGQVRPIRSLSGYDITETTIFQLYQELGGTKTMRQLSQTEKRLLRIYAVFQQMDRSGAIGDLNKTLNNTANQLRITSEASKELGTWIGRMVELFIAPALPYLNAFFITAKNIVQAIVKSLPNYSEFDGTIKGYEDTAEAMDEVQGRLLDFDKFRALSTSNEESDFGIDSALINGLTQYESILNNVKNTASELAEKWSSWWVNAETGELTNEAKLLLSVLTGISAIIVSLIATGITKKSLLLLKSLIDIKGTIKQLQTFLSFLTSPIGIIVTLFTYLVITNEKFRESILKLINAVGTPFLTLFNNIIEAFMPIINVALSFLQFIGDITADIINFLDKAGLIQPLLYGILIAVTAFKLSKWANSLKAFIPFLGNATNSISNLQIAVSACAGAIGYLLGDALLNNLGEEAKAVVAPIMILVGAIGTLVAAFLALQGVMSWGTALPVLMASIGVAIAGAKALMSPSNLQVRKNGGLVEDGLFTMNKGEIMGTFDDGTSIVANNQQIISGIKQGVYQAVSAALQSNGQNNDRPIIIEIDGKEVFKATQREASRIGLGFSKK